jgi:hypothetical protein
MGSSNNLRPPGILLTFFRWFCQPRYREDIEGDLLERFQHRVAGMGVRKANWLFLCDVLSLFRRRIIGFSMKGNQQKPHTMKGINWLRLLAVNILVILMIISPFIPGPSNKAVFWLSIFGQLAGTFGLLLVPVGLAWMMVEVRRNSVKRAQKINSLSNYHIAVGAGLFSVIVFIAGAVWLPNPMPKITFCVGAMSVVTGLVIASRRIRQWENDNEFVSDKGAPFMLAVVATSIITFLGLFISLFVLVGAGIIPGLLVLLLLSMGLFVAVKRIRLLKDGDERKFNPVPAYLLSVPAIAFLSFVLLIKPLSDFSRNFAIERSQLLIGRIEEYKIKTGQYPASVQDLNAHLQIKMADPSIMGIDQFRYNKIGDQYSISFSQWKDLGSLEEIVLYDKTNLKDNLSGSLSIYNYSFDLHRVRSAFASHDTKFSNWRYYLVD